MYCVKCGVELADSERKCPLCQTPVYLPGLDEAPELPYPVYSGERERINSRGIYFIITFVFLISAFISLVCDININGKFEWAGYVVFGLMLAYLIFILPGWFARAHPEIFVPSGFAGAILYVGYVCLTVGGDWFFPFALPVGACAALIVSAVVILCHFIRKGYLYIFGGAFIALGLFSVLIEWLMNLVLLSQTDFIWSFYPLIAFSLIGIMLIVIQIVRPLRESLCRIFSI